MHRRTCRWRRQRREVRGRSGHSGDLMRRKGGAVGQALAGCAAPVWPRRAGPGTQMLVFELQLRGSLPHPAGHFSTQRDAPPPSTWPAGEGRGKAQHVPGQQPGQHAWHGSVPPNLQQPQSQALPADRGSTHLKQVAGHRDAGIRRHLELQHPLPLRLLLGEARVALAGHLLCGRQASGPRLKHSRGVRQSGGGDAGAGGDS